MLGVAVQHSQFGLKKVRTTSRLLFVSLGAELGSRLNIFSMRSVMTKPPTTLIVAQVTAINPQAKLR
jgi:hypothetical protein